MKFVLPDGAGWQEVNIRETPDGDIVVDLQSFEDVTPIIEDNKKRQLGKKEYWGKGTQTSQYHLGQLSALKAHELMKQGIYQDDNALRRWFNDLENYLWRTVHKKRRGGNAIQSTQTH